MTRIKNRTWALGLLSLTRNDEWNVLLFLSKKTNESCANRPLRLSNLSLKFGPTNKKLCMNFWSPFGAVDPVGDDVL